MKVLVTCAAALFAAALLGACAGNPKARVAQPLPQLSVDEIAEGYVRLVLALGEHDPDYVDAYYGPPEWREQVRQEQKSVLAIRNVLARLQRDLARAPAGDETDAALLELRKDHLRNQLGALQARARMLEGWDPSFDDESLSLYDVAAPYYGREDFKPMLDALDRLLPPGPGTVSERYNRYVEQFAIPRQRLEPVMRAAIAAARARTTQYFLLPQGERFELAFVGDKPWSAYNWYQGNFVSRIEINTDLPITVGRAVELAAHEGYPGHHVLNVLVEDQLVKARGWKEFLVYPLFSPQSFIAEGSADFGMDLAFPPAARLALLRELFGLAGFDPDQAERYDAIVQTAQRAGEATIEAARRYLDGQANGEEALSWLQTYALATPARAAQRLDFFERYGAYIVNYAYGEQVVRDHIQRVSGSSRADAAQWRAFFELLTRPRPPHDLLPAAE